MQPVLLQGEEEAAQKAGLSESMNKEDRVKNLEMFKIDDDEDEGQNAENQSKLNADQQQPQHIDQSKEESKKASGSNEEQN